MRHLITARAAAVRWRGRRALYGAGLACLAMGLAVAATTGGPVPPRPDRPLAAAADTAVPESDWIDVGRSFETFSVSLPDPAAGPAAYEGERRRDAPARRDTLRIGQPEAAGPFLALSILRRAADEPFDLGAAVQRLAGAAIEPHTAGQALRTKFGPFQSFDAVQGTRTCLAFGRREDKAAGLLFEGLYCAAPGAIADRRALACIVDRIDLVSGADPALRALFIAAEKRRDFCGAGDPRAAGRRAAAERPAPRLRLAQK